ncbi:hypothetical protein VRU48_08465 [Pedobacter sp. KR3-3]|uniref:Uncharacterized protein n=1 Tax=Pedobacter albus TaxID=3113905 RepID=A0ABU7I6N9_9SPHI|nr:hypothetical protein [Pedobacter sp. KR3-3]MEE1945138.1 hypothetical protein [Pedobacter sp. KR3-3]
MVGIITLNQDTFTNPTLYSMMAKLNAKKIPVCLFCGYQSNPIPEALDLTTYFDAPKGLKLPRKPHNLFNYLKTFFKVVSHIKEKRIKHLIAVDAAGLILAGRIKRFSKDVELHYCSFEIFFADEIKNSPSLVSMKGKEIFYSNKLSSIIIQDPVRKQLLAKENRISPQFKNWHLIPVAPIVIATGQTKFTKADFGLKETDTVYIHSGSVGRWAGINLIINALEKGLPEYTYIFIHNKGKFNPEDPSYIQLRELQAKGAPVVLHDTLFESYEAYCSFLKLFDYGIVLYESDNGVLTGMNIQEIGLASGKFACYMALGLPSVLSNCKTYAQILENHAIGVIANEQHDLHYHIVQHSLQQVKPANCLRFYDEVLDPDRPIDIFINTIN